MRSRFANSLAEMLIVRVKSSTHTDLRPHLPHIQRNGDHLPWPELAEKEMPPKLKF